MQSFLETGVPREHYSDEITERRLNDWEGPRVFLEVVRYGSFRAASKALNLSLNSLRRRIERFEREVGVTVFTRHVDGVRLTSEGRLLLDSVQRMESASLEITRIQDLGVSVYGEVRLCVTEGLGTFWISPQMVELQHAYPSLLIDMRCMMHPADVLRLETDIAIQITRPEVKDLRVVKIGRLHAMPFASPKYLNTYGTPKTIADLRKHRIALQIADQITTHEEFSRLLPDTPQVGTVSFRTNVSSAHYWVIARGGGIGMLPTYSSAIGGRVIPIDIDGVRVAQDIWLTYHKDAAKIPRVRRVIDWLIECFSPKKYPWFRDEFVHPREFSKLVGDDFLTSVFEGMEAVIGSQKEKPQPPKNK